jgi:sugar phosphate isomerase/epimerase
VFKVCYDVGHAKICGQDPADMIRKIGPYIGCTHIHDNDGIHDSHTLPFYGTIDWENVMKAFAEIGYEGNLNYEAGLFVRNAPVDLRRESAEYMARIGKYLIGRYYHYQSNI